MRVGPGVWAVGDLTGKGLFTHIAMYQAGIAVADILGRPAPQRRLHAPCPGHLHRSGGGRRRADRGAGGTGAGVTVRTGHTPVPASTRGWIHKAGNEGFIKLVEDADAGVLVGATSAGPERGRGAGHAGAGRARPSAGAATCATMIYAYPTFHGRRGRGRLRSARSRGAASEAAVTMSCTAARRSWRRPGLEQRCRGWRIDLDAGSRRARRMELYAAGLGEDRPAWGHCLRAHGR